jgi:two-component sensor histidine kinase
MESGPISHALWDVAVLAHIQSFTGVEDGSVLAQAIVDTVREPLLVLDHDLRVIAASRSFYLTFKVDREHTQGEMLYALGDGQWNIPKLRLLLERIVPEHGVMEDYEVEHNFPGIGQRIMLLNARKVFYEGNSHTTLLLSIEDVTAKRTLERDKDKLLRQKDELLLQKDILLEEVQHRVANSLQIIASIILLKANTVDSEVTRRHLQDTHTRVISIATVQRHLHASAAIRPIEMAPYLSTLCEALSRSMIDDKRAVSIKVSMGEGTATSRQAESLGLIVTELVINSLKHAFSDDTKDGQISVAYEVSGTDWKLSVSDNGIGKPDGVFAQPKIGLGTGIVKALAKQLDAEVVTFSGPEGTTVSVTHATFEKKLPQASSKRTTSTREEQKLEMGHDLVVDRWTHLPEWNGG